MTYNHENWQVDAEKYFKKLTGVGILIFSFFWILLISKILGKKLIPPVKHQEIEK